MYSDKFIKLAKGYENKLNKLKTEDIKSYILELNNFSEALEMVLPEEMEVFLSEVGIKNDFKMWKESSLSMLKSIDEYGVDVSKKIVFVKKENDVIETPLLDINKYINEKNIQESWKKLLALSFMVRPENYEYYQITNALIMEGE